MGSVNGFLSLIILLEKIHIEMLSKTINKKGPTLKNHPKHTITLKPNTQLKSCALKHGTLHLYRAGYLPRFDVPKQKTTSWHQPPLSHVVAWQKPP